jgi:16S rRNA (adenine1518-N6/adenine1519-N6)-dimethyltransferase
MVKAKKYLGQHFLRDENVCKAIADGMTGHLDYDKLIEIGPGTGAITKYLFEKDYKLSVVEVDGESITYLRETYPELDIVDYDFLKLDLTTLNEGKSFGLFGNFPYFISTQILFKIYENKELVDESVGMFQKEVAERTAAKPGSKTYGIISVLLQAFYDIEYLFTVEPEAFDPPPKVKSGVIRLKRNEVKSLDCDEKLFKQVVKLGFNQRRKTLRNSLKSLLPDEVREEEMFSKRPEQLSVAQFVEICQMIEKYR